MAEKVFKTYSELIQLLISRNMDISTPAHKRFAKKVLQFDGYYNIINGYGKLFLNTAASDEEYKTGTTIEEVYALYSFDRELRDTMLKYILPVETNIKNLIAYTFSQNYGYDNYMLYKNFDTTRKDANEHITSVIAEFQRQLATRSSDPSISHYLKKYGYVPFWVLNNILTLGQLSKFYSIMKQPDRQNVSRIFHIQDNQLDSILLYLSNIRNFCAHGNRLFCFRTKRPIADLPIHQKLQIPKNNGKEYDYGKRDLFASLIALYYMLPKKEYNKLVNAINRMFKTLKEKFVVLCDDDVLNAMGFPKDWDRKLKAL